MNLWIEIAEWTSIIFFAWYGLSCFFMKRMTAEFERYRLGKLRRLVGLLQIDASIGILIGHYSQVILLISSGGLTVMMFLAVLTRFRIRDPWYMAIPAFLFFALNLFIFVEAW